MVLGACLLGARAEAAHFSCSSGEVLCLIASIEQANANGQDNTITLAAGVYTLTTVNNDADGPTGLPVVTSTLSITGAGAALTSLERAQDAPAFRIIDVSAAGGLTLRRLTVAGGRSTLGSGVLASGTVSITDSVVTNNGRGSLSHYGGGVAGGNVSVTRSTITGNFANQGGGGIYIAPDGSLTVENSSITGNETFDGGGGVWFNSQGRAIVTDSIIANNVTYGSGGGFAIGSSGGEGGASVTIRRSTISGNGNEADGGGIAVLSPSTVHISDSAFVGNFAGSGSFGNGGAIYMGWGALTMVRSTVARNSVSEGYGGLYIAAGAAAAVRNSTLVGVPPRMQVAPNNRFTAIFSAGTATLENTIVAFNTPGEFHTPTDCPLLTSLGHNFIAEPQPCYVLQPTDLTGDPGLAAFIDPGRPGTPHYPLLPDSRAIDAGPKYWCGRTDQLGLARPIDGDGDGARACDIGAIEFYPIVNDLVRLEGLSSTYVPPSPRLQTNPLTAGGEFQIAATFTNPGARDICHLAFDVIKLKGATGDAPAVLTRRGDLLGREGIVVPATLARAQEDLKTHQHEQYQFSIGLSQVESITFQVNVLGEATAGPCSP